MNLTISPVMGITPRHRIAFKSEVEVGGSIHNDADIDCGGWVQVKEGNSHEPVPYEEHCREVRNAEERTAHNVNTFWGILTSALMISMFSMTECSEQRKTTQFAEQTDSVLQANTINDTLKNVKFNDVDGDGVMDMEIFNPNDGTTVVVDFKKQQVLQQKTSLEPVK